jgi:hypothetical protein
MYCNNNAIDFVEVAKDLLKEDDYVVTESTSNLGLSVCKRMVDKKLFYQKQVWSYLHECSTFLLLLATKLIYQNVGYEQVLQTKSYSGS